MPPSGRLTSFLSRLPLFCFEHFAGTVSEYDGGETGGVMLIEFVTVHKQEIIDRCKAKTAKRGAPEAPKAGIDHGVPVLLDELVDELRLKTTPNPAIRKSATKHGRDLLKQGFTVSQVVHGYGDVCQSITEMAVELNAPISSDDFRILNRCLDDAIAAAVTEYGSERDQSFEIEAADE